MTIQEAASRLGISEQRVRKLAAQGRILGAVRHGKSWAIPDPIELKPGRRGPDGSAGPKRSLAAGLYRQRRSRITGTMVSIYDARRAGLDDTGGAWAVVCDDHGEIVNVETLRTAKACAPLVEWCESCYAEPSKAAGLKG